MHPLPAPPQQTNDDAITVTTAPVIVGITSKHYNPQGCEVPATCAAGTGCKLLHP